MRSSSKSGESRLAPSDLAEALPQIVFELDANGRFACQPARLDLFGFTREDSSAAAGHDLHCGGRAPMALEPWPHLQRRTGGGRGAPPSPAMARRSVTDLPAPVVKRARGGGAIFVDMRTIRETEQQLRASESAIAGWLDDGRWRDIDCRLSPRQPGLLDMLVFRRIVSSARTCGFSTEPRARRSSRAVRARLDEAPRAI